MRALEAERTRNIVTVELGVLPTGAAAGKLEGCARVGAGARTYVPLIVDRDCLREGDCRHQGVGELGGAGIDKAHIQLKGGGSGTARNDLTAI
jgi:hypothetical protein